MLKKQVAELSKLSIENQSKNEELQQYGRRLSLRVDGILAASNESCDDVMKSLFKEAKVSVLGNVLDRAYRIGVIYTDRVSYKKCENIVVRFTTFCHRTLIYRMRNNLKSAKVKLYLTKSSLDLLRNANNHVKEVPTINFCYVDVNFRIPVKFHDEKPEDTFFS